MSNSLTKQQWQEKARALSFRNQALIDGKFVAALSGKTFASISPLNGRELTQVAECDAPDAEAAVKVARRTFESGVWSRKSPRQRKMVMVRWAELMLQHAEELALLETLDMGKPITDSLNVDVRSSANCIRWFGEAIDKIYDEVSPTGEDEIGLTTREPVGVVACIVPWNFPLLMTSWKLGPALAAGNSVILKPSEKSPLSALRLAELALEAGLPPGVLNILPGYGHTVGKALALHMDVDCIAFTGSTGVGKQIMQMAGQSNLKRAWLECGGKSPHIIFADCPNMDAAAEAAAYGIFYNQGEMCSAGSRLLVEQSIADEFVQRVLEKAKGWQPGDPLDPATKVGALVDDKQLATVLGFINKANEEGCKLLLGGKQTLQETGGYFVESTVFGCVEPRHTIAREEIFGPVLSVLSFKDAEEAVRIANDTHYGLAAALWTRDISKAHKTAKAIRAGSIWVNCYDGGDITTPFGGYKQSGNGRDKSLHALDKYTELKATWINLNP
ncbi:MAG TPA: aldehyde dehydrogenase [Permianibacter sp.]|nr:aldehyde dehydrogenase [Permianibacter sp.]